MKGVTTHFKQALMTVLIALAATLVLVCSQDSPSSAGPVPEEAPRQERGQVFTVQPIDFVFAPVQRSEPVDVPPANPVPSRTCFGEDSNDLLSYLLVSGGSANSRTNIKIECVN